MSNLICPSPKFKETIPGTNTPAVGYLVYTFLSGTTTKTTTYTTLLGTANTNPIVLDSNGEADIWLPSNNSYKLVFTSPNDNLPLGDPYPSAAIWTVDDVNGGVQFQTQTITGNKTATLADNNKIFLCNANSSNINFIPPSASSAGSQYILYLKKTDASANTVTFSPPGSNVDGGSTFVLTQQFQSASFFSDGTQYWTLNNTQPYLIKDTNGNTALASAAYSGTAQSYLTVQANSTASNPILQVAGTATNQGLDIISQGTGSFRWKNAAGIILWVKTTVASAVNYITSSNSATSNAVSLTATGSDSNINFQIAAKGTGIVVDQNNSVLGNPTGTVIMWAASSVPNGYLECTGQAVSRSTYATLFALIGTTFGAGDGSTTFNVPDIRGRAPIGAGTGAGLTARSLAGTVGEETHILTTAELAAHTHAVGSLVYPVAGGSGAFGSSAGALDEASGSITSASAGSGNAHNNMQPSLVLKFMIKI